MAREDGGCAKCMHHVHTIDTQTSMQNLTRKKIDSIPIFGLHHTPLFLYKSYGSTGDRGEQKFLSFLVL
jgi:hypothetical protein